MFLAGVLISPIPGPGGIPLMLLGLGILSLEFEFARRWLAHLKERWKGLVGKVRARRANRRDPPG